jgi:small subunit ribosomal protein S9
MDKNGTGRRKTAVSSVILREGTGKVTLRCDGVHHDFQKYFPSELQQEMIYSPLKQVNEMGRYDILINVRGGGKEAQATATRLGISRALVSSNPDIKSSLREVGFLTRDPRKKERKKYGQKGARKRFQFSKR